MEIFELNLDGWKYRFENKTSFKVQVQGWVWSIGSKLDLFLHHHANLGVNEAIKVDF